ncbi:hypothetical protein NDU88_004122 [Pleurodeles waltl]|uniref:Uncharacterized protein n=1 Tax=Pleurodeles waltl TaxID=8319 RepID=A0AAV7W6I1_PLEWA|nr:hypothetical protein NDU88_004122 [Pleurodeles waltl]
MSITTQASKKAHQPATRRRSRGCHMGELSKSLGERPKPRQQGRRFGRRKAPMGPGVSVRPRGESGRAGTGELLRRVVVGPAAPGTGAGARQEARLSEIVETSGRH